MARSPVSHQRNTATAPHRHLALAIKASRSFLNFDANWDGLGSARICIAACRSLARGLAYLYANSPSLGAPHIVPLSTGGLQAEWHLKSIDVEIEFEPIEGILWFLRDRAAGKESEGRNLSDLLRSISSAGIGNS
jgi:hypothetical protein